jgi:hypothetical protein
MKKFLITEEEKSRILGMHKSAIAREFLGEQGTPAPAAQPTPVAAGTQQPAQPVTQPNPTLDRLNQLMGTSLPQNARNEDVINAYKTYLGTDINGMVGKTIVVFKNANTANPTILGSTIASEFIIGSLYFNGTNTTWVWKTPIKTNFNESDQENNYTVTDGVNAIRKGVSLFTLQGGAVTDLQNISLVKQRLTPLVGTFGMVAKDQTPYSSWVTKANPQNTNTGFFTITPFIAGTGAQLSSTITPIAATPATPTKP